MEVSTMPKPLSRSLSRGSSDLFEPDDPDFLQTLLHMKLPGDVLTPPPRGVSPPCEVPESERVVDNPDARNTRKRPRSTSPCNPDETDTQELECDASEVDSDTYGASRFGGFGEYMRRKRAKLQIQNTQMALVDTMSTSASTIFRGLAIYVSVIHLPQSGKSDLFFQINGWTEPSVQDLRQLILQHGGIFHAYLDKKSLVCVLHLPSHLRKHRNSLFQHARHHLLADTRKSPRIQAYEGCQARVARGKC